jgi:hypothetical protein
VAGDPGMLIDETNEELMDRIESIVYILAERMDVSELQLKLEEVVFNAISDVQMERGK